MVKEDRNNLELSIVVLCYKAGKSAIPFVEELINTLKDNEIYEYELILVGNYQEGTDDETPEVVRELAANNPNVSCIAKPKVGMMGWDMRTGLDLARGQYISVIDGDGQMPSIDLIRVYNKIKEADYDLVKTYRVKRNDGLIRKLISTVYNIVFQLLFPGTPSRDINSKPKILTRNAYKQLTLKSDDWFIDAEIMLQASKHKFNIGEIETTFLALRSGRKSFIGVSAVIEFIKNLILYKYKGLFK